MMNGDNSTARPLPQTSADTQPDAGRSLSQAECSLAYESGLKVFDYYWRALDSHDARAATMIGFTGIVLALAALGRDSLLALASVGSTLSGVVALSGTGAVLCLGLSVVLAAVAWFIQTFPVLPSPKDTLQYLAEHGEEHAQHMLVIRLDESVSAIQSSVRRKSKPLIVAQWLLVIGVSLLFVAVFALWLTSLLQSGVQAIVVWLTPLVS